ncbi:MAG: tRNA adenosine(34) deaminase TadA [Elusimicrobiota bacterium]
MKKPPATNEYFMARALTEARKALRKGEVPIGAVVVSAGKIIGRGHNLSITANDPTAHAEVVALRAAARTSGYYRLTGCKLFVTIEPCPMCAGALVWARVAEIVFGAKDPKAGACGSVMNIARHRKLNHRIKITAGVMEDDCRQLIQEFFKHKRKPR